MEGVVAAAEDLTPYKRLKRGIKRQSLERNWCGLLGEVLGRMFS